MTGDNRDQGPGVWVRDIGIVIQCCSLPVDVGTTL